MALISRCYAVLGLEAGASLQEVHAAYRHLVKEWHPDLFPDDPLRQSQGQIRMAEINVAYSQLKAVAAALPRGRPPACSWDKSYSIGIRSVDKQHEIFFKMLNNFNDSYASSSIATADDKVTMKIYLYILNLRRYAFKHFVTEEEYMVKYHYPAYAEHRKKHDRFIKQLFKLEDDFYNSNKMSPNNITDFILSWLEEHIKRMDKDFGRYLNEELGIHFIP